VDEARHGAGCRDRVVKSHRQFTLSAEREIETTGGPMEMSQIRYFLALSEELNFTRAAKRCGISQPSLTNGINVLERHLGGPLVQRRPRIALTALGLAIWPHLKQIAQSADDARETARTLSPRTNSTSLMNLREHTRVQEVEGVIHHAVVAPALEVVLQRGEVRTAVRGG
jgi:DNA-binding MarR family transcriptional regulator